MSCNPRHQMVALPWREVPAGEALQRVSTFCEEMARRRTIRDFAGTPVSMEVITTAIRAAATAPSGANVQPWHFVVVTDPAIKRRIREATEEEERAFYAHRASQEWLAALEPLGTNWRKPFLETAPALIAVFEVHRSEETPRPYYTKESVGIAVGILLAALHQAGLAALTHTPSPMRFLGEVLGRPAHERAFVLIPVGYPAAGARVPDITRKPVGEVLTVM